MIFTCTLSPSVDVFVELDKLEVGSLNRMKADQKLPGGKGINVSRVLNRLDTPSVTLGFIGGFTGAFINNQLQAENIETRFLEIKEDTRINVKIKADDETEINGQSPALSTKQIQALHEQVASLNSDDTLVLSGSIPSSLPATTYRDIIKHLQHQQANVVVDTSGDALAATIPLQPFLIKPNQEELGQLFNTSIMTPEDAIPYAKKLIDQGVENVMVSLAGNGALFMNQKIALKSNVPQGEVKNSVGAGDSMVAGFLANYEQTGDVEQAFQYAVAAGSATAFSVDLCQQPFVNELVSQVRIESMSKGGAHQ